MSGCECKSGFFALRDCTQPVAARCPICRRAMCRQHAADAQLSVCLDCAAGKRQKARTANSPRAGGSRDSRRDEHTDDREWLYERRYEAHGDRVYRGGRDSGTSTTTTTTAATAAGAGAVVGHEAGAFDEQDVRGFDHLDVERDDGDATPRGFGDS